MTTARYLDNFQHDLTRAIDADAAAFEQKFGKNTRVFLDGLPGVFMVLRRAALDVELNPSPRRLAAAAAFYLVESRDFLQAQSSGVSAWLDDLWVAYHAFARLLDDAGDERLEQHWRWQKVPFAEGRALAANISSLKDQVPSRVLGIVDTYLA